MLISLNRLAWLFTAESDLAGARQAYDQAIEVAERLAAANPGSARAALDVASTFQGRGDALVSQGDLAAATKDYQAALAFDRKAVAADPTSTEAAEDIPLALQQVGDALAAQGDLVGARADYRAALDGYGHAASVSAGQGRDLALAQGRIGDRLLASGDPAAARQAFEASVSTLRRLAGADPASAAAAHDLELALGKLSFAMLGSGGMTSADAPAQEALAIARRLAASGSPSSQADLAFALGRYGDLRRALGDDAGARAAYLEALGIDRALAWARPDAILPARTVGEMMATLAALPGGGVSWAQVVAYDEGLQARGLFEAADVQQLLVYQQRAAGARPAPR